MSPVKSAHSSSPPATDDSGPSPEPNGTETADVDTEPAKDEEAEEDDDETPSASQHYFYPEAVTDVSEWSDREAAFKAARFLPCTEDACDCRALVPPDDAEIQIVPRTFDNDVEMEDDTPGSRTGEGWWRICGNCEHGWEDGGHVWGRNISQAERNRRTRTVGRIEELLQVRCLNLPCRKLY